MLTSDQKLRDRSALPVALVSAIDETYRVFARHHLSLPLRVCRCAACVDETNARLLVETPLRDLTASILGEYTDSAHGYDEDQDGATLRHYLPHYFELVALNDPPAVTGDLPQCLVRLGQANYRANWSEEEADAIDRYFDALLVAKLADLSVREWPVGHRLAYPMNKLLEMIVLAGGDTARVLATLESAADPGAALHMAGLAEHLRYREGFVEFASIMLDRDEAARRAIGTFLAAPRHVSRLENAFYLLDGAPMLPQILSDGQQIIGIMSSIAGEGA